MIVKDDEMTIDLSALPKEVNAPMNSGRSGGGETVARLAFRYLLLPEGDANEGTFRPLKLSRLTATLDDPSYAFSWREAAAREPLASSTG